MIKFPDSEFDDGAFSDSGVALPQGGTNGQTCTVGQTARMRTAKRLKITLLGFWKLSLLPTPHLRMEAESLCETLYSVLVTDVGQVQNPSII